MLLSRFSSLRFLAASASKLAATRNATAPASNLLLHTSATRKIGGNEPTDEFNPWLHYEVRRYVNENDNTMSVPGCAEGGLRRSPPLPPDAPRAAVILSGSGAINGTDPLEAACLIIQLAHHGIKADFFAPNTTMNHYWSFLLGMFVERQTVNPRLRINAREEAARLIPMHRVRKLNSLRTERYDALIIPGGAGAVLVLSDCVVNDRYVNDGRAYQAIVGIIEDFRESRKPIGTISYAGFLLTEVFNQLYFTMGHQGSEKLESLRARDYQPRLRLG